MNGDQEPWIVGDQERRTLWSRGCVSRTPVSISVSACVCTVWTRDTIMMIVTRSHWLGQGFGLKTQSKESATPSACPMVISMLSCMSWVARALH